MYFVYVLECSDGSLYTGVATDVERRIEEHNAARGAKYVRGRTPVRLLAKSPPMDKGSALKLEFEIKKMPRLRKLECVLRWNEGAR